MGLQAHLLANIRIHISTVNDLTRIVCRIMTLTMPYLIHDSSPERIPISMAEVEFVATDVE